MEKRIRKITAGNNLDNACQIGSTIKGIEAEIVRIEDDKNYFALHNVKRILVFVKYKDGIEELWKEFNGVPVSIEYFKGGDNLI